MPELKELAEENKTIIEMENLCHSLFNEWLLELNFHEKEIWLWNALVEMAKIKERRRPIQAISQKATEEEASQKRSFS